jgi:hypothetical protein
MTRPKGVGRGNAPGSRRALRKANATRQAQAITARRADRAPTARPHLRQFQTGEHMAELRRRKAAKRPDAVAARRAQEEVERQAERERLARDVERHRTRPITILTASRWFGESPVRTLTRVVRGAGLRAVRMEDGSTRVRASDVEQLIRTRARRRREFHTPSTGPCGIGDGQILPVAQWALIFGSAHPPYIVLNEPVIPCPRCGHPLEAGRPRPDGSVPYRCSRFTRCDYETVRQEDTWRKPPGFWGPWSAPPPEYVVERRVADITFAHARAYFADREAALMPDFESPGP